MSVITDAKKRHAALGEIERQILDHNAFSGTMTGTELLRIIDHIHAYGLIAASAKSRAYTGFWFTLVLGISIAIVSFLGSVNWLLYVAFFLWLVAFAYWLPLGLKFGSKAAPNFLNTYVAPVIAILREDGKRNCQIKCSFDLTRMDTSDKLARTEKVPKAKLTGNTRSRTDYHYHNPWFSVEATLIDGTKYKFEIVDFGRMSKMGKRSRSGKYKSKTKCKLKRVSRVTARPGPNFTVPQLPPPLPDAKGLQLYTKARSDGSLTVRSEFTQYISPVFNFKTTPSPSLESFINLTGRATQSIQPVQS